MNTMEKMERASRRWEELQEDGKSFKKMGRQGMAL